MLDSMPDGDEGRADVTDSGPAAEGARNPHEEITVRRPVPEAPSAAGESARIPRVNGLEGDVIVIGAGVTGLTAALALKRAARRVIVLDARPLRESESCRTTAHLTEVPDTRLSVLLKRFGLDDTRLLIEGQRLAIAHIEQWAKEIGGDCGFERLPGYLYAEPGDRAQRQALDAEAAAAEALGYGDIRTTETPAPFDVAGALRFDNQAQFRPGSYIAALESQIYGHGSVVVRGVRVMAIETDRASARCRVSTSGGEVQGERVVVATDVPIGERSAIRAKLTAYRSYAVAARARRQLGALMWDLASPYHHARTARIGNRDFLIAGGGDHRVGEDIDTRQVLTELDEFVLRHFGPLAITHHWSGQIIETADGLPYVGAESADDARVLFATGLSGNGITSGTLAGLILADLVRGHANPWAQLLAPDRARSLASVGRDVGRNLAAAKRRLTGRIKAMVTDVDQLRPSAGMLMRRQGERLAVYRSATGALRALSAACPSGRGHVRWNGAEKSWDCPCHGSRFDPHGRVLNGPAVTALPARAIPGEEDRDSSEPTVHELHGHAATD
jgi:glycine/D-amino acid oxidase-like deaminating enzyme/nitrite reductase/ring-hydroxylating ferredoxin subunit